MSVLTGLAALAVAAAVLDRDWAAATWSALVTLFLGGAVGFLLLVGRRGSGAAAAPVAAPDGSAGAVRFGYSTAAYGWFTLLLAVCAVFLFATALGAGVVLGVVLFAGTAVTGWYLLVMLRHAPGGLLLSPAGLAHRGLTSFYWLPWDAVRSVGTEALGTWALVVRADPSPRSVLRRHAGRFDTGELEYLPFLVIRSYWLAADREVVRQAVDFYLTHPERRGELATGEAVRRIAEGRLDS
ncbi:hypothetical protein [Micromonospora auratinigra]|uniref:hypothetical protein n=1 Tax=Micromonospora auratinigra TaxID=261654 RepID=UPI0012FD5BFB|nr:hypothetical protein [Micromonospora auratinigra]